jgi:hypothetical protein
MIELIIYIGRIDIYILENRKNLVFFLALLKNKVLV